MKYRIKDYEDIRIMVDNMTVDELILSVVCPEIAPDKPTYYPNTPAVFFHTRDLLNENLEKMKSAKIHPLIVADMESMFVSMRACATAGDESLAYEMGKYKAADNVKLGYHWGLGPCIDLTGNPDNPIVCLRTPGKTVEDNIKFGTQFIKGMQDYGIMATAKHFPGDGYCRYDQHITCTENPLPFDEWMETFGKSYKAFIDAGVRSIMPGHISLPSYDDVDPETGVCRPGTLSPKLLKELLKKELGFEGIIVTDAVNMGGFCGYMNYYRACAEALEAGCDCLLFALPHEKFMAEMHKFINEGVLTIETLKDRAYRMWCFVRESSVERECLTLTEDKRDEVEFALASKCACIERDRYNQLPLKLNSDSKILFNIIDATKRAETTDKILGKLKSTFKNVDVIEDVGPDGEFKAVENGNYDAIICYICGAVGSYGTNTGRLCGPIARNMMGGWQRLGTPVVFITPNAGMYNEYVASMDILINNNGSFLAPTLDQIMKMIMG